MGRRLLGRGYDERIFLSPVFRYSRGGLGANVSRTYKFLLRLFGSWIGTHIDDI